MRSFLGHVFAEGRAGINEKYAKKRAQEAEDQKNLVKGTLPDASERLAKSDALNAQGAKDRAAWDKMMEQPADKRLADFETRQANLRDNPEGIEPEEISEAMIEPAGEDIMDMSNEVTVELDDDDMLEVKSIETDAAEWKEIMDTAAKINAEIKKRKGIVQKQTEAIDQMLLHIGGNKKEDANLRTRQEEVDKNFAVFDAARSLLEAFGHSLSESMKKEAEILAEKENQLNTDKARYEAMVAAANPELLRIHRDKHPKKKSVPPALPKQAVGRAA